MVTAVGCGIGGGNAEPKVSSSGDPQADQRAAARAGSGAANNKPDSRTLYERLGGADKIAAIVDDMTERVLADPRVNFERQNVKTSWVGTHYKPWEPTPANIDQVKRHMVEFLTLATGGPSQYTGRDMHTIHKDMRITNNEFDAMIGDAKTSMDKLGIAAREKRDLLAIFETTRKQIVERQ